MPRHFERRLYRSQTDFVTLSYYLLLNKTGHGKMAENHSVFPDEVDTVFIKKEMHIIVHVSWGPYGRKESL